MSTLNEIRELKKELGEVNNSLRNRYFKQFEERTVNNIRRAQYLRDYAPSASLPSTYVGNAHPDISVCDQSYLARDRVPTSVSRELPHTKIMLIDATSSKTNTNANSVEKGNRTCDYFKAGGKPDMSIESLSQEKDTSNNMSESLKKSYKNRSSRKMTNFNVENREF